MRFHIHRRKWSEPFSEQWQRPADIHHAWFAYAMNREPRMIMYERTFQIGTCDKCGHAEKREVE